MNQSERFIYEWLQREGYLPSEITHITDPLSVFVMEDGKSVFPRRLYGDSILLYRTQVEEVFRRQNMVIMVTDGHRVTHAFPVSAINGETMQFEGEVPALKIKIIDLPGGQLVRISDESAAYLAAHNLTADTVIQKFAAGITLAKVEVALDDDVRQKILAAVEKVKNEILRDGTRPTDMVSPIARQGSSCGEL